MIMLNFNYNLVYMKTSNQQFQIPSNEPNRLEERKKKFSELETQRNQQIGHAMLKSHSNRLLLPLKHYSLWSYMFETSLSFLGQISQLITKKNSGNLIDKWIITKDSWCSVYLTSLLNQRSRVRALRMQHTPCTTLYL